MAITTKSRAIHISPDVPDLFLTTLNMPQGKYENDLDEFISSIGHNDKSKGKKKDG